MLDDTQQDPEKITLTQKEPPQILSVMADGSILVFKEDVPPFELHRLLLNAAALIARQNAQRIASVEGLLRAIDARCQGFPEDVQQAIATVLNPPPPGTPGHAPARQAL
jgi:hypothetical protein